MEGKSWILANKTETSLFIRLTYNKVGKSLGLGRPVWEWTEDFNLATGFAGYADVANAVKKHKIPIFQVLLRPYENAFSTWLQKQAEKDQPQ